MKILVTGRGKSASWKIRGEQLGTAIDAVVDAAPADVRGYDLAVIVKRQRADVLERLHAAKVPIVWDVVDAWPQPIGNEWNKEECRAWLAGEVKSIKPLAIVAATQAMAADCAVFDVPVLALPHHARPDQKNNPLRETVSVVGYEGGEQYLGEWRGVLERQCARRGWTFHVNPKSLADLDIVVAVRAQRGYAAMKWKSNVKLANAQGSGTPSIVNRAAGYIETSGARQYFADDEMGMSVALDTLTSLEARREEVEMYRPPKLRHIAREYRDWLWAL